MINATDIEMAERLLRIVVGDGMSVQGQFEHYKINRDDYEKFHKDLMSLFIRRTQMSGIPVRNELMPVLNTLMTHHFLVGYVCGVEATRKQTP